jgi:mono/diheme cytochrome c family protein
MRPREPRARRSVMRARPAAGLLCLCLGLLAADAAPVAAQRGAPWVAPERRAARPNPLQPTADNVAEGKKVYMRECQSCHGAAGNNDGPKAPKEMAGTRKLSDPTFWTESDGALFWKIGEGRRPMPSTFEVLNDRERWQVVIYIRTLAPKPSATSSSLRKAGAS